MGQHPPHLTKQPHWVAFPPETQNQLEQALGSGGVVPYVVTLPNGGQLHYEVDAGKKEQKNLKTGYKRPVLRDTSAEGQAHGETLKRKVQAPPGGWGEARPEESWDQDALLLRKDSIVQVSKQREQPFLVEMRRQSLPIGLHLRRSDRGWKVKVLKYLKWWILGR